MPAHPKVRLFVHARALVALLGVWYVVGCTRGYELSDYVRDAPVDYCRLLRAAETRPGLVVVSPYVAGSSRTLTHTRTTLTVQSVRLGDGIKSRHAVVVAQSPSAAGAEVLRFAESDPGSGAAHWVGISDDGHSGYVSGSTSSAEPFVQADGVLRLQFVPARRKLYRLRPCVDTVRARVSNREHR